jgi:hypothetical protein
MKRLDQVTLARWQALPAAEMLLSVADHAKEDRTYKPIEGRTTTRWHATVNGSEFELLLTGPKFYDTRAKSGGGGAIDLLMHLTRSDFRGAVRLLQTRGL